MVSSRTSATKELLEAAEKGSLKIILPSCLSKENKLMGLSEMCQKKNNIKTTNVLAKIFHGQNLITNRSVEYIKRAMKAIKQQTFGMMTLTGEHHSSV